MRTSHVLASLSLFLSGSLAVHSVHMLNCDNTGTGSNLRSGLLVSLSLLQVPSLYILIYLILSSLAAS
jgi:hypothetical protein